MKRQAVAHLAALIAGWMVVLYYSKSFTVPFSPFLFLLGAMMGITLAYLENSIPEWIRSRKKEAVE